MNIAIRFQYGGKFELMGDRLIYRKGLVFIKTDLDPDMLSKFDLEDYLKDEKGINDIKELWYLQAGKSISDGLKQLIMDVDIREMLDSIRGDQIAHVYVVRENEISPAFLKKSVNVISSKSQWLERNHNELNHNSTSQGPVAQLSQAQESDDSDDEDIIQQSDSSSSDSNFSFKDSEEEDDDIFEEFVDHVVVDDQSTLVGEEADAISIEELESDDSDCLRSGTDSDAMKKPRYPEFNRHSDFKKPISLKVGMIFGSNDIFRRDLRQFSISKGGDFYYLHNDKRKVSAYCKYKSDCIMKHARKKCVCKEVLCGFKACARKFGKDGTFQLKSFNPVHSCGWHLENSKVTSVWLAEKYIEHYRDDPHWRISAFMSTILREYTVSVNYSQAYRARMRACIIAQGDASDQYGMVWDYAAAIITWNPGSSAYVKVDLNCPERPLFQRLYICLDACKKGFLEACRPIIGLDGCHLKGVYTGQVLVAVGKDGNENIFPVAYAVVEAERKETWCWFLENLMQDLGNASITFMSDRQKGLIEALNQVVPMAGMRVCVRHLYNNFKVKWPGKAYKDALWEAAKATTKFGFDSPMNFIKSLDEAAFSYLIQANPRTWSRHAFTTSCKSDMLLNNVCESFNSYILEARDKPILTMCEWIRRQLMKRFSKKREGMTKYAGTLTPKTMKKLEAASESLNRCIVYVAGEDKYEVDHGDQRYVVDLTLRSCGCYKWNLTGVPCCHAVACILKRRLKLENFVDHYYSKESYLRAYNQIVNPMRGQSQWEKSGMTPPYPPKFVVQPGRPKKARRREDGEQAPAKKKRIRFGKNKCSHCGSEGHTKRTCKNPHKPPAVPKTSNNMGGRPKKSNTFRAGLHSKRHIRRHGQLDIQSERRHQFVCETMYGGSRSNGQQVAMSQSVISSIASQTHESTSAQGTTQGGGAY